MFLSNEQHRRDAIPGPHNAHRVSELVDGIDATARFQKHSTHDHDIASCMKEWRPFVLLI